MAMGNELQRRVSTFPLERQMPAICEEPNSSGSQSQNKATLCPQNSRTLKSNLNQTGLPAAQAPIAVSDGSSTSSRSLSSSDSSQTIHNDISSFVMSATSLNGMDGVSVTKSAATRPPHRFGQELKDQDKLSIELIDNESADIERHEDETSSLNDAISSVSHATTLFTYWDGNASRDKLQEPASNTDGVTISLYSFMIQIAYKYPNGYVFFM